MEYDEKEKIEPIIESEGYALCPICGYFDLDPEYSICPNCKVELNWEWFYKMKIRK